MTNRPLLGSTTLLHAFFACLLMLVASAAGAENLLSNGGMERAQPGGLPVSWEPLIIGGDAKIVSDASEKHAGALSVRIDAPESMRVYACSEQIPVAPGDELIGSAWVRVHDVVTEKGTAIMIAEFFDASGKDSTVEKFDVANLKKLDVWQQIKGTVKVPDTARSMRVRVGFSYAKGTCWWDDVAVSAKAALAARIELAEPRLSPALRGIPVLVINRNGSRASVKLDVSVGKENGQKIVTLSGAKTETIEVPVTIPAPGKATIKVSISIAKTQAFAAELGVVVPAPIVLPVVSPTHWCVEDGAARIDGRVDLALSDAARNGARLGAELRDSSGRAVARWDFAGGAIPDGITEFSIDAGKVGVGDYTIVAELMPRAGKAFTAEQPWHVISRRLAKVTLNAGGYPVYDGRAILPLGIFNGGKFKEQADAGFTVAHAYNAARITPGQRNQDADALRWLNESDANGMKMLLMVPMKQAITGDWETIRRRVRMFRNHPGLLAWDEEEGFARGDFKPDTLKKLSALVREEDPNHPFMVGDPSQVVTRITDRSNFFPVSEMDLGMWWWYPFPLKARSVVDALNGEEASSANEVVLPEFLTLAKTSKPIWVGVQSYKKGTPARYPTPAEYRCQAYLGLVAGAKGLMWYGGSVTNGLFLAPEEGHWEELKQVVREVHDLGPVFMSPSLEMPTVSPAKVAVSVMLKRSGNGYLLFAVNRSEGAVDVVISSPFIRSGAVAVRGEKRSVRANSGAISDHFDALAVHVYELP